MTVTMFEALEAAVSNCVALTPLLPFGTNRTV
jgi:hypothetical protein